MISIRYIICDEKLIIVNVYIQMTQIIAEMCILIGSLGTSELKKNIYMTK